MTSRARVLVAGIALPCLLALSLSGGASATHSVLHHASAGGNAERPAGFAAASADGTRVLFETSESLSAGDGDAALDVYERSEGVTTLVSAGPSGNAPARFAGASDDATRVFFETDAALTGSDTDSNRDVYERSNGQTTLLSTGSSGGGGAYDAAFRGASTDGSRVFIETDEALVAADTDTAADVYQRSSGDAQLVSTGPAGGAGPQSAYFSGASEDGSRVFFSTTESMVAADTDAGRDVYERAGGITTLVSNSPAAAGGDFGASFNGASADGRRVFFQTHESLTGDDTDSFGDVYERANGVIHLLSTGDAGGNGEYHAWFAGATPGGTKVFIETDEALTGDDTDTSADVYERSGGVATLVSTGPAAPGGDYSVSFSAVSDDGDRVLFDTDEPLVTEDEDEFIDVYERSGTTTSLVSRGSSGGNGRFDSFFGGASEDASRIFFSTSESLSAADVDSQVDVYERGAGQTALVSNGSGSGNGDFNASFKGASDDGARIYIDTREPLASSDTDNAQDVYVPYLPGPYARPQGAVKLRVPLVIAYEECVPPANRVHGPSLLHPSCSPARPSSPYLTVGTPDANQQPTRSVGSARITVTPGNLSTPQDEADVALEASITDVRRRSDLSGYDGELLATAALQITDRYNGSAPVDTATVTEVPLWFTLACAAVSEDGAGSTCSSATSADAVIPGAVREGKRSIWELEQVMLSDGGADGYAGSSDNFPFARQGIFVP